MAEMTSRERVATALNHKEPDRVPLSIGGSAHKFSNARYHLLREHFGLTGDAPQRLTGIAPTYSDNRLLDILGVDFRYVHLRGIPVPLENRLPDGSWIDEWGLRRVLVGSYYELVGTPLKNATIDDLKTYPWPDPFDPVRTEGLREEVLDLYENTSYAITAYRPTLAGVFDTANLLLGMETNLLKMMLDRPFIQALYDKLHEIIMGHYQAQLDIVGPYVQIVEQADDLGTQRDPLISPKLYRELVKPRHAELNRFIKQKAPQAKVMLHTDGSVRAFIPDFIEAGFDILNPVQPLAKGMNPAELKAEFGSEISFLGGVDVQQAMIGPVEGVREEVRRRIEELGPGGGYIIAPSHNFQDDTPLENLLAFFEAVREYGAYS